MEFYQIDNYRQLIRHYFDKRARAGRGEVAKLAKAIRVQPAFVSQVLTGKKDFSMEQCYSIAQYLELSEPEQEHLFLLVQKDRAGTSALKKYLTAKIEKQSEQFLKVANRLEKHRTLTDEDKAFFYSSWINMAVWLATSIGHGMSLESICEHLDIDRKRALEILDFLCEKNLCVYEDEVYKMGTQHIHIPNDSPYVVRHHMNWRLKALQRHERVRSEEIAFTSPVSISKKDFHVIREKILKCIKESIQVAKDSEAEDIAFLNIDWLWVDDRE